MIRWAMAFAVAIIWLGVPLRVPAAAPRALDEAGAAWAKIDDYRMTMSVHEVLGAKTEDETLTVLFKRPSLERVDVIAGANRGSGVVWQGGDTVKAHRGGLLSGLRATFKLHDRAVSTLRGASIDAATIPAILARFAPANGNLSEAPGPPVDGVETVAVTLETPNAPPGDITRDVLYLSSVTHLPVRRDGFAGTQLVRSLVVTAFASNTGLTNADFPW